MGLHGTEERKKQHQALDKHAVTVYFIVVLGVGCMELSMIRKTTNISRL